MIERNKEADNLEALQPPRHCRGAGGRSPAMRRLTGVTCHAISSVNLCIASAQTDSK